MVGRGEPRPGLDDRRRDAEAGVDLGQLAAGRPATQHEQARVAARGRASPRGSSRSARRRCPRAAGPSSADPTATTMLAAVELVGRAVVADLDDRAAPGDPGRPAIGDRAGRLERLDVARVVGLVGVRRPVDHVVAPGRRPRPRVGRRVRRVVRGAVEQRLGRDAADVRTAAAEPAAIDDGHGRAELARLVGGRLAGRAGADDRRSRSRSIDVSLRLSSWSGRAGGVPRTAARPR